MSENNSTLPDHKTLVSIRNKLMEEKLNYEFRHERNDARTAAIVIGIMLILGSALYLAYTNLEIGLHPAFGVGLVISIPFVSAFLINMRDNRVLKRYDQKINGLNEIIREEAED